MNTLEVCVFCLFCALVVSAILFQTDKYLPLDHNDECEVCDEPGDLVCCDFCNTVLFLFCTPGVLAHEFHRCGTAKSL